MVVVLNIWIEVILCNVYLCDLVEYVKVGIRVVGGIFFECNIIVVSDGIIMGILGMRVFLVFCEVIVDFVELVVGVHDFQVVVVLCGCDKIIFVVVMVLVWFNLLVVVLYGGFILLGKYCGKDVIVQDVFEVVGAVVVGCMSVIELCELEESVCFGVGVCGGQFIVNIMVIILIVMGLFFIGVNDIFVVVLEKVTVVYQVGELVLDVLERDL